jgi:hypothetical protein
MQASVCPLPQYLVGRDRAGFWIATDMEGSNGGLFKDKAAALHYAGLQTALLPGAVRLIDEPLELRIGAPPRLGVPFR